MTAPGFTCPRCGRTSFHPMDVAEKYCGACHDWTGNPGVGRIPGRYGVFRVGPDAPSGWERFDGHWVDLDEMPTENSPLGDRFTASRAKAVATGRFETRRDGATAEVYEIVTTEGNPT